MDFPSTSCDIKMEPGNQYEDGGVKTSSYIEIEVPNIKEEYLDSFEGNHHSDGKNYFWFRNSEFQFVNCYLPSTLCRLS